MSTTRRERRKAQLEARRHGDASALNWRTPALWGVLGIAAVAAVAFLAFQPHSTPPDKNASASLPGIFIPSMGDVQLQSGQTYTKYTSNPPTSGPYAPTPSDFAVYTEPQPMERLVHSMEMGGVIIWYNCANCDDIVTRLTAIAKDYQAKNKRVILVPYGGMDSRIAVTSWTRLLKQDQLNEDDIKRFIEVHERRYNPKGL